MAKHVADTARKLLLLGQCVPSVKQNATKIRVKRLELDENLLMVKFKPIFAKNYPSNTPNGWGVDKGALWEKRLKKYFRKDEFYYCHDPAKLCKTGDIVLIKALPQKLTKLITHEVKEVVYPFGDVTDPVTGKKVAKERYREDVEKQSELYGKLKSTFIYDKAPPRGWQEGKKDMTGKPTYTKFHVFDENDPYAI